MNEYSKFLDQYKEFGVVNQVYHPLAVVSGLPHVLPLEVVMFENGDTGQVFSIGRDTVDVLVFSGTPVKVGSKLVRTGKNFSIPVSDSLLGSVIDPLGKSLSLGTTLPSTMEQREIDQRPYGIGRRSKISKPFLTGVTMVDMMVPLGKGQKELIIGDRKTGKTSFVLSAIKYQVLNGTIGIYAGIGKKKHDIKKLEEFFKKEGILSNIVMVATSSNDAPSLIMLTPYTAMTIAEYFRDQGKDVLIVFDDLSTHAKFYREISLIAKRFPGRDSYPGDIFFLHSALMERSGNYKHDKKGEVSITCLPIVDTVESDLTGYITTNLMGMTDGHIYFDSNIYFQGRRPAINLSLSVTRVGRQTQQKVKRDINRELTAFLALYEKMQNFSHFGAELTESVKHILYTGEKIYKFFNQQYTVIVPSAVQLILFSMLWLKFIEDQEDDLIMKYRDSLINAYNTNDKVRELFDKLIKANSFNALLSDVTKLKDQLLALYKI